MYSFDAGIGIWKGLSARLTFPLLDVSFSEGEESGREFGVGDLSVGLRYNLGLGGGREPFKLGATAGVYLPTGGTVSSDIPSNPNFASGTLDALLGVQLSYDLDFGLGFFARFLSRLVPYENADDYRAGHSFITMAGVHYRLFDSLVPAVGLTGLNRTRDRQDGVSVDNTGGDWIYLAFSLGYVFSEGPVSGLSLYGNVQIPVYQFLHGTQLAEDFNFLLGVAYAFNLLGD